MFDSGVLFLCHVLSICMLPKVCGSKFIVNVLCASCILTTSVAIIVLYEARTCVHYFHLIKVFCVMPILYLRHTDLSIDGLSHKAHC